MLELLINPFILEIHPDHRILNIEKDPLLYTHIDDASFIFNCTPSQECLNRDLVMEEFWDLLFSAL